MKDFITYRLAVEFYRKSRSSRLPAFLKNQLMRAASSIALNLNEGNAKSSSTDRKRFFGIAYASAQECKAIFDLEPCHSLSRDLDCLCAHLYKLWKNA